VIIGLRICPIYTILLKLNKSSFLSNLAGAEKVFNTANFDEYLIYTKKYG
jgi:hypothetical protein